MDPVAKLVAAALAGALLGLNRDLHHKPAGLRTHALVSLGSALTIVVVTGLADGTPDALSRVVQGVLTGIGFVGAGVIMHHDAKHRVEGLTTAASIWVAAGIGIACGAAMWLAAALGLILTLAVLTFGGRIERAVERALKRPEDDNT